MKLIYSNYRIVGRELQFLILCNDGRFDDRLSNSKRSFVKVEKPDISGTLTDNFMKIDFINTFLPDDFNIKVARKSFLYIKWKRRPKPSIYQREFLFLGLKRESDLYVSKVGVKVSKTNKTRLFNLFSSLINVKEGEYELVLVYKRDSQSLIKSFNIKITII